MALTADAVVKGYRKIWIDSPDESAKIDVAVGMYRRMVLAVLLNMLERSQRDPAYGYVDMKVDLITGEDFAQNDEIRGKRTIFGWIQGRSLEALAGHAKWVAGLKDGQIDGLDAAERNAIVERCRKLTRIVMDNMETLREKCGGRLSFMMRDTGEALRIVNGRVVKKEGWIDGGANVSDLFYGKGLAAAAAFLGDTKRMDAANGILQKVLADVRSGKFVSDQEQLDAKNPVGAVPGRIGHGARMLLIGAAALMIEITRDPQWAAIGREFISHNLARHVNAPKGSRLGEEFDMWEFVNPEGKQFMEGSMVRSDPGHATEFAGFSLKFLRLCEENHLAEHADSTRDLRCLLGGVLKKNFRNGFSRKGYGLCKAYNIVGRTPINSDMPWWNLPETIRAGMEAVACEAREVERWQYADIVRQSSNAFMEYFVRADRWLMANQTIDENGTVVARVPATPDADPGYHTGLSLIDALARYERMEE